MNYRRSLARTALFALVYVAAVLIGWQTVLGPIGTGLMWPAGVAAVWFCAQRRARARWADFVALPLALTLTVQATHSASPTAALAFGVTSVLQALIFCWLLSYWRPNLWGAGGTEPMRSPTDLWGLLGAALGASLCGAAVGVISEQLFDVSPDWSNFPLYLTRYTASILVVGSAGVFLGSAVTTFRLHYGSVGGWWWHCLATLLNTPLWRIGEYTGIVVVSTGAYLIGFGTTAQLPLTFVLLSLTVLVATRLSTPFVLLHNTVMAAIAVQYTIRGKGPFSYVTDLQTQTILVQIFLALVMVVGLALALGRDERNTLMAELAVERAELAEEQQRAAAHADLLATIIDSMAGGLAVVEPDGQLSLRNPAFTKLLSGFEHQATDPVFGLFRLDGTRYSEEEIAHLRAHICEEAQDLDVLVRSPDMKEGRIVQITATPLPHRDGTRSAVVILHDVTDERRHRDELANFAGVVAHDLLNPLSSVDGWTTVALAALSDLPPHPNLDQAIADLTRSTRASERMRGLIDDLLAYTTARDAAVAPATVDLGAVVADIAEARTDAAVGGEKPAPRFTIGELPPVEADPVLLRQLLDNLIGNAIKYTAAEITPTLTITGHQDGDMVEICIADNGIGIPAGQHDAIFGNFHRAHTGGGYQGTGLGLAICKRIVERHNGTITAADNPGGGSCFTVTLPAAVTVTLPLPDAHPGAATVTPLRAAGRPSPPGRRL